MSRQSSHDLPLQEIRKDNAVHASLSQIHLSKNAGSLRKPDPTRPCGLPHETRLPDLENRGTAHTIGEPSQRSGASRAPSPSCQPGQSSEPAKPPRRQNDTRETKTVDHPAESRIIHPINVSKIYRPPLRNPKVPLAAADDRGIRTPDRAVNGQMTGARKSHDTRATGHARRMAMLATSLPRCGQTCAGGSSAALCRRRRRAGEGRDAVRV